MPGSTHTHVQEQVTVESLYTTAVTAVFRCWSDRVEAGPGLVDHCYALHSIPPPQTHMVKSHSSGPQNITVLGNKAFKEVNTPKIRPVRVGP